MVSWISLYKGMKRAVERTEGNCGHCLAVLRGSGKEREHTVRHSKAEIVDNTLKMHRLLSAQFLMRMKQKELNPLAGGFVQRSLSLMERVGV